MKKLRNNASILAVLTTTIYRGVGPTSRIETFLQTKIFENVVAVPSVTREIRLCYRVKSILDCSQFGRVSITRRRPLRDAVGPTSS